MGKSGRLAEEIFGDYENIKERFRELEECCDGKNDKGKGGMLSKIKAAEKLYQRGISTIIGNVKYPVHELINGKDKKGSVVPRTIFKPIKY